MDGEDLGKLMKAIFVYGLKKKGKMYCRNRFLKVCSSVNYVQTVVQQISGTFPFAKLKLYTH